MPILDSHHHLWDPAARAYSWMDTSVAAINRRFDIDDLRAAAPLEVTRTIVVQAAHTLDETQALLQLADGSDLVAGVVGWIDLTASDAAARLAGLQAGRGGAWLCGIRHQVHDEPDPNWLLRADVGRGIAAVAAANVCYDLLVRTRELAAATTLVQRFPQLRFVLDHGGKPAIASGAWEPWSSGVAALAALPNVVCKLSGLITEARHDRWSAQAIAPYAQRLLTLFGPRRVLFGSDWPVCLLAGSYARVLDLAATLVAGYSAEERAAIFHDNAQRTYLERST